MLGDSNIELFLAKELLYLTSHTDLYVNKRSISSTWYSTINNNNSIIGGLGNLLHLLDNSETMYLQTWSEDAKLKLYGAVFDVKSVD